MNKEQILKVSTFIECAVEWLVEKDDGCSIHKLDDRLAVVVGWMGGFDVDDDGIHSKTNPTYCITIGICVWTSDDLQTDMEFINAPYYENGEVVDCYHGLYKEYDALREAIDVLDDYEKMKDWDIDKSGLIKQ